MERTISIGRNGAPRRLAVSLPLMRPTAEGKQKMTFEAGKVYHQQFEGGDREFFLAVEQFKNKRWKGYRTTGNRKPVQAMGDPSVPSWIETAPNEIPVKLARVNI